MWKDNKESSISITNYCVCFVKTPFKSKTNIQVHSDAHFTHSIKLDDILTCVALTKHL